MKKENLTSQTTVSDMLNTQGDNVEPAENNHDRKHSDVGRKSEGILNIPLKG